MIGRVLGAAFCLFSVYLLAALLFMFGEVVNAATDDAAETTATQPKLLKITWERPQTYLNDEPLPLSDITGYDLYHTLNGGEVQYTAWIAQNDDITHYDYTPEEYGRYCFQMVTVSKSAGKSPKSEPVCIDYTETIPQPANPCAPTDIEIQRISGVTQLDYVGWL